MGEGQPVTQASHIGTDRAGNGTKLFEGRIPLSPLDSANVSAVDIRFQSEVLLRKAFRLPGKPDAFAEHFKRRWFSQP